MRLLSKTIAVSGCLVITGGQASCFPETGNATRNHDPVVFKAINCSNPLFAVDVYGKNGWHEIDWEDAFGEEPKRKKHQKAWEKTISHKDYQDKYHILSQARHDWVAKVYRKQNLSVDTRIKIDQVNDNKYSLKIGIRMNKSR